MKHQEDSIISWINLSATTGFIEKKEDEKRNPPTHFRFSSVALHF
jgi:hypothetical protein